MHADDYQLAAARTLPAHADVDVNLALGLGGEAGELQEVIKKLRFHGHPLNKEKLIEELGDVLWYLTGLCTVHGLRLADVMDYNIEKLWCRYPQGFSAEASLARVDVVDEKE